MRPDKSNKLGMLCWCRFCWWLGPLHTEDPCTTKSRAGYAIFIAKCLEFWYSKCQSEISFPTATAKHIALSFQMSSTSSIYSVNWLSLQAWFCHTQHEIYKYSKTIKEALIWQLLQKCIHALNILAWNTIILETKSNQEKSANIGLELTNKLQTMIDVLIHVYHPAGVHGPSSWYRPATTHKATQHKHKTQSNKTHL